jgi:hypothetical protein
VEFTKSPPGHSNDNGLAETKNGALVRKHLGYSHIPQRYAREVNAFCQEFLNPYVNFHRPCFFAESSTDDKGKTRKRYLLKNRMTPSDFRRQEEYCWVSRVVKHASPRSRIKNFSGH